MWFGTQQQYSVKMLGEYQLLLQNMHIHVHMGMDLAAAGLPGIFRRFV